MDFLPKNLFLRIFAASNLKCKAMRKKIVLLSSLFFSASLWAVTTHAPGGAE